MKEDFKKLKEMSFICVKNISDLYIIGDAGSIEMTAFRLQISRCHDEPGKPKTCATENEIDEFIDYTLIHKLHETD